MRITTIAGIKGGGTKSTCAQVLSTGIPYVWETFTPEAEPPRVLLIDHDPQATASGFNGVKDQTLPTLANVLGGSASLEDVIIPRASRDLQTMTRRGNRSEAVTRRVPLVDIVPANQSLHQVDIMYPGTKYLEGVKALVGLLRQSPLPYTHIIFDTPGTVGPIHLAQALTVSDDVILPVVPDTANFDVLDQTIDIINDIRASTNPALSIDGLLISRSMRTTISSDTSYAIEQVAKLVDARAYRALVREQNTIKETQSYVFPFYERTESKQTHEYIAFIAEYLGIFDAQQAEEYLSYMYATLKD